MILCVHLGGASRQIEGREDPSRPGKNQGGTGQEGRTTSFLLCAHTLSLTDSVSLLKDHSDSLSRRIHRTPHFFVNFTSEAAKRRENRSLQCLIMCVYICWGGSKESERGFGKKRALRDNADTFYTKHPIPPSTIQAYER